MTINDAVFECRKTGLSGWELVHFAQKLVGKQMEYSNTNSFDFPTKAFKMGKGYCWHQSKVLFLILRKLEFECHLVFAAKNQFANRISGHVWCRVTIDGIEKDVCPGNLTNAPGIIDFVPLTKVKKWNVFISFGCYFASAVTLRQRKRTDIS